MITSKYQLSSISALRVCSSVHAELAWGSKTQSGLLYRMQARLQQWGQHLSVRAGDDFDSPSEKLVCEGLRQRGYEVHAQVGCSGYRIDLAVVDPESAGRYLLGIECDGANYHRAKTARDRDRLREIILHDLGWKLHRVWSTDWWANPQKEMERIEAAIELARKSRSPVPREEIHEREPIANAPPAGATKTVPVVKTQTAYVAKPIANAGPPVYQPFPIGKTLGDLASFYQSSADAAIRRLIEAVVRQEGPISLSLAARRVAAHWGLSRVSSNIQDRIGTVGRQADVRCVQHGNDTFFWPNRLDPTTWREYRVTGEDEISRREARDLPPEEIANAALKVLPQQVSLPAADLMRETARLFGFHRMGQTVEKCMREGIALLFESGKAFEQEEMIVHRPYEC